MRLMGETTGRWYDVQPLPVLCGGQAEVRCAFDEAGRFAVKTIRRDRGRDDVWLDLEVASVSRLVAHHPYLVDVIVPIVELASAEGRRALVMPWYDLRLDDAAEFEGFPTRLAFATELVSSVERMQTGPVAAMAVRPPRAPARRVEVDHTATTAQPAPRRTRAPGRRPTGIVHRDIKPSNALAERQSDGTVRVRLCDLGGAALAGTVSPERLFSADYAPLDQQLSRRVDPAWDVYATAGSVFQLLTRYRLAAQRHARQLVFGGLEAPTPELVSKARRRWATVEVWPMLPVDRQRLESAILVASDRLATRRAQRQVKAFVLDELFEVMERALDPYPSQRAAHVRDLARCLRELRGYWTQAHPGARMVGVRVTTPQTECSSG